MSWYASGDVDKSDRKVAEDIAATFRAKLTDHFGVTMVQDHAGDHGRAGAIYLTLRHKVEGIGDCHMTMEVVAIKKGMV